MSLLAFCARSLIRDYGTAFLGRVIVAHPLASARGLVRYWRGWGLDSGQWEAGPGSLVGLGFCLKPMDPPCPAGRANHRCAVFDGECGPAESCNDCLIRDFGGRALGGGSALYVMTSARDILDDVLLPSLRRRRFQTALLVMCRYSFEPIRLAFAICGIKPYLTSFEDGDCRDYTAWRRADLGDKPERTCLSEANLSELTGVLEGAARSGGAALVRKRGNLYEAPY